MSAFDEVRDLLASTPDSGGWTYGGVHGARTNAVLMREARKEQEATVAAREAIAAYLIEQAALRFDTHGPYDARGAAFWDIATGIREGRIPTTPPLADDTTDEES